MIYFISDAHLGCRLVENPREHEMRIVRWLDSVKADAEAIFLMGDMFDFWFEYRTVVPKGYVRFLGKLAELVDAGIEVHFFTGNHDIWTFGYLEDEVGLIVHHDNEVMELKSKSFFLGHGDNLIAENDKKFSLLRSVFHSKLAQWLFRQFPPLLGQNFGYTWSKNNRKKYIDLDNHFLGEENEAMVRFAKAYSEKNRVDFMVFGHRHIELNLQLSNKTQLVILGDFIGIFSYAVFDGENIWLENFE